MFENQGAKIMILIFNLIGFLLVILIIWWFWVSKSKAITVSSTLIRIEVRDGVYAPARVKVNSTHPVVLEFIRKDNSPCSETVIFETLDKQERLPFNQPFKVNLGNLKPGTYPFNCQMNMYSGELIVS
jgi:plastocyanin domain-containing protein